MAKKGRTGYSGLFAFIAICFNALAWVLKFIEEQFEISMIISGRSLTSLLTTISSLILTLVVLVVAHDFVEHQTKGWRILYWVLAIISIAALLFGIGFNFAK